MATYKITTKTDHYFIEATAEEINSDLFKRIWEAMLFESVEKYVAPIEEWNEEEVKELSTYYNV